MNRLRPPVGSSPLVGDAGAIATQSLALSVQEQRSGLGVASPEASNAEGSQTVASLVSGEVTLCGSGSTSRFSRQQHAPIDPQLLR